MKNNSTSSLTNSQSGTVNSQSATERSRSMPKGWEIKKLGEVCKVIAGQSPKSKYYNNKGDGLPFYQGKKEFTEKFIGEPTKWTTKITKEAIKDDVLMSVRAPVGPINFATQKICIGRGLASIRAGKQIDKEFLFNFLLKHEDEIVENAGAVFNSINKKQIEEIPIPIPPLPEQKRIVAILDRAFSAIDRSRNIAEQNLNNAKELFESYLNRIFEEKGEDWDESELNEYVNFIDYRGRTPKKVETGIRLITAKNIKKGFIQKHPEEFIAINDYEKWMTRGIPKKGDVLFTTEAPLANVAQLDTDEKVAFAQRTIIFQPNPKTIFNTFLKYLLLSKIMQDKIISQGTGATVKGIKSRLLKKIKIFYPKSIETQQQIVAQLDALQAETKKLEEIYQKKITNLEELKKSVLQKAFRGELTNE